MFIDCLHFSKKKGCTRSWVFPREKMQKESWPSSSLCNKLTCETSATVCIRCQIIFVLDRFAGSLFKQDDHIRHDSTFPCQNLTEKKRPLFKKSSENEWDRSIKRTFQRKCLENLGHFLTETISALRNYFKRIADLLDKTIISKKELFYHDRIWRSFSR